MMKNAAIGAVLLLLAIIFVLRAPLLLLLLALAGTLVWFNRERVRQWLAVKLVEWKSDARQLGLWLKLAFTPRRDVHQTATMAHQMAFLSGRVMSPMNLFAVAALAVALLPLLFGFEEWRISNIKGERDRACSGRELSKDHGGNYQTTREACADLGRTQESAIAWRARAQEEASAHRRDVEQVRSEGDAAVTRERQRRQRDNAALERQRRRDNETISSAFGGAAPDLERSLCELAGQGDCPATGTGGAGSGAPAANGVPGGPSGASGANAANAAAGAATTQ